MENINTMNQDIFNEKLVAIDTVKELLELRKKKQ
jgi:hypothetical protein